MVPHSLPNEAEGLRPVSSLAFFWVGDDNIERNGERKACQMNQLIRLKRRTSPILILVSLISVALLLKVQAVVPAPDGGYPGGNTAEGQAALLSLTSGTFNTAIGFLSLRSLTDGQLCTGVGAGTLLANTGDGNTAIGAGALLSNTTGPNNTANGAFALFSNTEGNANTATGSFALLSNTTGFENTATGKDALTANTTGNANTAIGDGALGANTTGGGNVALGFLAGVNVTTADNVICIDHLGQNVSNSCFIGHIRGVTTGATNAIPVLIDSAGQLGTMSSSRRFKKEIRPMDQISEAILALKPVTFHYKSDKTNRPEFGLIAEEVAEINPDLVVRNENGEIYTVRYDAVNAMLLNEFLKEHKAFLEQKRKVQELEANDAEQQREIKSLVATVKEQAAQIQKVSAQVELSKAPLLAAESP
jgi:hypothetical protein